MEIKKFRQGLSNLYQRITNSRIPTLKPGDKVYIKGVGDEYSGLYYVDTVSHSFSLESYRDSFTLTRNDAGRSGFSSLLQRGVNSGIPVLRPGGKVKIIGVGEKFSGTYFVDKVNHSLSAAGYQVPFTLTRNDTGD